MMDNIVIYAMTIFVALMSVCSSIFYIRAKIEKVMYLDMGDMNGVHKAEFKMYISYAFTVIMFMIEFNLNYGDMGIRSTILTQLTFFTALIETIFVKN